MKTIKTTIAGALALVILLSSFGMIAGVSAQDGQDRIKPFLLEEIELQTGSTDRFGGGDFVLLKLRNAKFAVLYGNETNPNNIIIAKEFSRHVGGVDVRRDNGDLIESTPITVRTLLAQRFMFMVEFKDKDHDMMLDNVSDDEVDHFRGPEPVKATSLNRSWTISDITEGTADNGSRTWDFALTITNVGYDRIFTGVMGHDGKPEYVEGTPEDGVVEEISLIFHISVSEKEMNFDVPWFNVEVTKRRRLPPIVEVNKSQNKTFNGTSITAEYKYDHVIDGWDFADRENKLALETNILMGMYRPPPKKPRDWQYEGFERRIGGEGEARFRDDNMTPIRTNFTDQQPPRLVGRNQINFTDDWTRVGRFRWVSDVEITNDGVTTTEEMWFQVHGGGPMTRRGFNGTVFKGFVVRGAFIYPSGDRIFHDPTLTTDVVFMDIGEKSELVSPTGILFEVSVAIIAIAAVLTYRLTSKKK